MRTHLIWTFLILCLGGLHGCFIPPPETRPDPCVHFSLTRSMWSSIGSQAQAQFDECTGKRLDRLSATGKIIEGTFNLIAVCPLIPVTPPMWSLFIVSLTPVIFLPIDLIASPPAYCDQVNIRPDTLTTLPK